MTESLTHPAKPQPPTRRSSARGMLVTSGLMVLVLTILFGLVYPLVTMAIGQIFFHDGANGSLVKNARGQIVGSSLLGQSFTRPQYFHPRLSAAGRGYDATSSGGTNLGPTSKALLKNTIAQANLIRKENNLPAHYVLPADAVSTSASGLDPDISPAYAALQEARVARARGMTVRQVRDLVDRNTAGRTLGFLGEPRVNVLELNLALDRSRR